MTSRVPTPRRFLLQSPEDALEGARETNYFSMNAVTVASPVPFQVRSSTSEEARVNGDKRPLPCPGGDLQFVRSYVLVLLYGPHSLSTNLWRLCRDRQL